MRKVRPAGGATRAPDELKTREAETGVSEYRYIQGAGSTVRGIEFIRCAIKIRTHCAVNVDRNPVSDRNSSLSARKPNSFYSTVPGSPLARNKQHRTRSVHTNTQLTPRATLAARTQVSHVARVHRQSFHFDTEDTGPAYTQVQIQHRSRAPGPPYNSRSHKPETATVN